MDAREGTVVVLVAEDDPHALSGYLEFLGRSGFVASGSGDGQAALELAVESVPDIVVTDINMPGLDGFELAAALKADRRTRHVPIVGMTGHWTADMQMEAQRAGFSAMLLKPCLPTHLLAEVERLQREDVPERELEKVINRLDADLIRSLQSNSGLASQLAYYQAVAGDWRYLLRIRDRMAAVTPADVRRVASTWLTKKNRTVARLVRPTPAPAAP